MAWDNYGVMKQTQQPGFNPNAGISESSPMGMQGGGVWGQGNSGSVGGGNKKINFTPYGQQQLMQNAGGQTGNPRDPFGMMSGSYRSPGINSQQEQNYQDYMGNTGGSKFQGAGMQNTGGNLFQPQMQQPRQPQGQPMGMDQNKFQELMQRLRGGMTGIGGRPNRGGFEGMGQSDPNRATLPYNPGGGIAAPADPSKIQGPGFPRPNLGNGTGSNSRTSTDWAKRHPEESSMGWNGGGMNKSPSDPRFKNAL